MSAEPVTVIVRRTAKAGRIAEFEEWMQGIIHAAMKFEGFMGVNVIRPQDSDGPAEYVIIIRFDSYQNLAKWENSKERHEWAKKSRVVAEGEPRIERRTGLEFWFTPTPTTTTASTPTSLGSARPQTPPRYKMAMVLVPVIALLLATVFPLIQMATEGLHPAVRLVVGVGIMVLLMTYVVMPAVTRLLRPWLYKKELRW